MRRRRVVDAPRDGYAVLEERIRHGRDVGALAHAQHALDHEHVPRVEVHPGELRELERAGRAVTVEPERLREHAGHREALAGDREARDRLGAAVGVSQLRTLERDAVGEAGFDRVAAHQHVRVGGHDAAQHRER